MEEVGGEGDEGGDGRFGVRSGMGDEVGAEEGVGGGPVVEAEEGKGVG